MPCCGGNSDLLDVNELGSRSEVCIQSSGKNYPVIPRQNGHNESWCFFRKIHFNDYFKASLNPLFCIRNFFS